MTKLVGFDFAAGKDSTAFATIDCAEAEQRALAHIAPSLNAFLSQLRTMALATCLADQPDKQVRTLAKRYRRSTISPGIRANLDRILTHDYPADVAFNTWVKLEGEYGMLST